jgi:5-methylcytosine-specific restriction endonuclease McrA
MTPMLALSLLLSATIGLYWVAFKKKCPSIPLRKKAFYKKYIQSSEWKRKRRLRIKFDGGMCRGFHLIPKRNNLHVHHKTYSRLGNESVRFDLITLCEKHHKKEHKK